MAFLRKLFCIFVLVLFSFLVGAVPFGSEEVLEELKEGSLFDPPRLLRITPSSFVSDRDLVLKVEGYGFSEPFAVSVDGVLVTDKEIVSLGEDGNIYYNVFEGSPAGTYEVKIITLGGESESIFVRVEEDVKKEIVNEIITKVVSPIEPIISSVELKPISPSVESELVGSCEVTSVNWNVDTARLGQNVSFNVESLGDGCDGEEISFEMVEEDLIGSSKVMNVAASFEGNKGRGNVFLDSETFKEYVEGFWEFGFGEFRLIIDQRPVVATGRAISGGKVSSGILSVGEGSGGGGQPESLTSYAPIGWGCTNAFWIDRDCDGYGVGGNDAPDEVPPTGPDFLPPIGKDANDFDLNLNTPASAASRYGLLDSRQDFINWMRDLICIDISGDKFNCYTHEFGDFYFISPLGDDVTGIVNDPSMPFRTTNHLNPRLNPGDVIVYREGMHSGLNFRYGYRDQETVKGNLTHPIIYIAAPGERAQFADYWAALVFSNDGLVGGPQEYLIFDGLELNGKSLTSQERRSGIELQSPTRNLIFRNLEITRFNSGIFGSVGQPHANLLFDSLVIHDSQGGQRQPEHGVYLNNPDLGEFHVNLTFKDSLIYRRNRHGLQLRPPYVNLKIVRNIFHSNAIRGIEIKGSIVDSEISNNLFFNNGVMPFLINREDRKPYKGPIDNVSIFQNTIWVGTQSNGIGDSCWMSGGGGCVTHGPSGDNAIGFFSSGDPINMTNLKVVNNVVYTSGGALIRIEWLKDMETALVQKNFHYSTSKHPGNSSLDLAGMNARCLKVPDDGTHDYLKQGDGWCVAPNNIYYAWSLNSFQNKGNRSLIYNNELIPAGDLPKLFTNVSTSYAYEPGSFDFNPATTSLATDNSNSFFNSKRDLKGNLRTGLQDSGAYEFGGLGQNDSPVLDRIHFQRIRSDKNRTVRLIGRNFQNPFALNISNGNGSYLMSDPNIVNLDNNTGDILFLLGEGTAAGDYNISVVTLFGETKPLELHVYSRVQSEIISLKNNVVDFTFVYNNSILSLENIRDISRNRDFPGSSNDILAFGLRESIDKKYSYSPEEMYHEFNYSITRRTNDSLLILYWSNVEWNSFNKMNITLFVTLEDDEPVAEFAVYISTDMNNFSLYNVTFPRVSFEALSANGSREAMVLPWVMGNLLINPRSYFASLGSFYAHSPSPSQTQTFQLNAYYDLDTEDMIFFGTRDPNGYIKGVGMNITKDAVGWDVNHIPENHLTYNIDYLSPYTTVLGVMKGDWFDAATFYRNWSVPFFASRGKLEFTPNVSREIHNIGLHLMAGVPNRDPEKHIFSLLIPEEVRDFKDYYSTCPDKNMPEYPCDPSYNLSKVLVEYYGWADKQIIGGHGIPNDYRPINVGLMEATKRLQEDGNLVIPYTNNMGFDESSSTYNSSIVNQYSARNESGILKEVFHSLFNASLVYPNPSTEWWQNYTRDYMIDLLDFGDDNVSYAGTGFDGAYWDVWSGGGYLFDYSVRPGVHSRGGGNYWDYGEKKRAQVTRQGVTKIKPGWILESEHPNEFYINELEFAQQDGPPSFMPGSMTSIPLFPTLYNDYIATSSMYATRPNVTTYGGKRALTYLHTIYFSYGVIPSVSNDVFHRYEKTFPLLRQEDIDFWNLHKQLTRSYHYAKKYFFYGQLMRPLDPIVDATPLTEIGFPTTNYYSKRYWPRIPNVITSVWRANDGDIAIAFINWNNVTEQVNFTFDFEGYELTNGSVYYFSRLTELGGIFIGNYTGSFNYSVNVPNESLYVFGLSAKKPSGILDGDGDGVPNVIDRCPNTSAVFRSRVNRFGCPMPFSSKFSRILSTNFSLVENLSDVKNLALGIDNRGLIRFGSGGINLLKYNSLLKNKEPLDFDSNIFILKNSIFVDSGNLPMLNVSADLTFFNTGFSNPLVYRDGEVCGNCLIKSFNLGTTDLIVGVNGFSNYTVGQGTCGDKICGYTETKTSCPKDCGSSSPGGGGGGGGGGGQPSPGTVRINLDDEKTHVVKVSEGIKIDLIAFSKAYRVELIKIFNETLLLSFVNLSEFVSAVEGEVYFVDFDHDKKEDIEFYITSSSGVYSIIISKVKSPIIGGGNKTGRGLGNKTGKGAGLGGSIIKGVSNWVLLLLAVPVITAVVFFVIYFLRKRKMGGLGSFEKRTVRAVGYSLV